MPTGPLRPVSGELDLAHLASLIDARTKLVCCTGASNFLGTRNPLAAVRALADASGYYQPNGERRSWLLVDGAQLIPGSFTDVHALGADYLAFSLNEAGIESRAGCHCATLAHHALGLTPPASCRLSFYLYNTPGEVDLAVDAVAAIAAGRGTPGRGKPGSLFRSWPAGRHRTRQRSAGQNGAGQNGAGQQGAHEPVPAAWA